MLAARNLAPRHRLGQNFLIDHQFIRKLVDAAHVNADELVLEVGPGTGTLTEELLARGARVVACELDAGLAGHLREYFAGKGDRFVLIEGDCLQTKRALHEDVAGRLAERDFVHVANLPYAAATPLITTLLLAWPRCRGLFVMIQREVGQRLTARPGTDDWGPLSVVAQITAEVEIIAHVPPSCFWPQPDVTSSLVALRRRAAPLVEHPAALADFAQAVLGQRRKQLGAVLRRMLGPAAGGLVMPVGIAPTARAENLTIAELEALRRAAAAAGCEHGAG